MLSLPSLRWNLVPHPPKVYHHIYDTSWLLCLTAACLGARGDGAHRVFGLSAAADLKGRQRPALACAALISARAEAPQASSRRAETVELSSSTEPVLGIHPSPPGRERSRYNTYSGAGVSLGRPRLERLASRATTSPYPRHRGVVEAATGAQADVAAMASSHNGLARIRAGTLRGARGRRCRRRHRPLDVVPEMQSAVASNATASRRGRDGVRGYRRR